MPFLMKLTVIGAAKVAAAQAGGPAITLTEFAVGDGDGAAVPAPTGAETELVNERWRGTIDSLTVKPGAPTIVVAEAVLPSEVGGWMVHELGIFDDEGDLFAYGNFPATYKPLEIDGSTREMIVRAELRVSSAANVTLVIDPALVMATRAWCLSTFLRIDQNLADVADPDLARDNLGAAPINSPAFTGNPTAPTPAPGDNDTSIATTAFVRSITDALSDVPVGSILPIAGPPPANWLKCDGSSYLQSAYPTLFAKVGTLPRLTWTKRTSPASMSSMSGIRYLNGNWVTLGSGASASGVYSADNGVTWNTVTGNLANVWRDMCWTGAKYVISGSGQTGTKGLSNSAALGAAFTVRNHPWSDGALVYGVASDGAGKVVAVCNDASQARAALSTDHGDTWAACVLPGVGNWSVTGGIVYAAGRWVFAATNSSGNQTNIYTSTDGSTWTLTATLTSVMGTITHFAGKFYAYGQRTRGYANAAKSADGITWTALPTPAYPMGIASNGLAGIDRNRAATLPNGLFTFNGETNFPAPGQYVFDELRSLMHLGVPDAIIQAPGTTYCAYGNGLIMAALDPTSSNNWFTAPLHNYDTGTDFIVPDIGALSGTMSAYPYIRAT